ncbi:hypothetical protein ACQP60_12545 [Isoptericola variabilis]|uniref:hypothetical protein n=1 Tax=Isoptericola variabilis TaxID=139208 RepID=UPI003D19DDC4
MSITQSITERLRRLAGRHVGPPAVPPGAPTPSVPEECGQPVPGTMTVQPLYCPTSAGGGYR